MQGGNQQAKQVLAQKASQYAQQGFQPQPTTRVLVQSALGYDAFQQQGQQFGAQQFGQRPFGQQQFGQQPFGGNNFGLQSTPINFGGVRF